LLEVNQIFVVTEDLDIGKASPGTLDFFRANYVLRFLVLLSLLKNGCSPGPLNLDSCNMVHGKSVVLEKSPSKTHLIGGLDKCSTKITHASVLIASHLVEGRSEELLPQRLTG